MEIASGQKIELRITFIAGYACWGLYDNFVGFVPCEAWSDERPIPDSAIPRTGQQLPVRIVKVLTLNDEIPEWATFGGKFKTSFTAAVQGVKVDANKEMQNHRST